MQRGGFASKGEVTMQVLIPLVLAILAFLIVGGWLINSGLEKSSKSDVCHLSVLGRAQTPGAIVPLKCETNKICVSDGNGKCADAFAGEDIEKVTLPSSDTKALEEIQRVSADAMYDCWKVMGEGKLDLFGSFGKSIGWDKAKPVCVICSRIAYDIQEQQRKERLLNSMNLEKYLAENTPSDLEQDFTYAQAFLGDSNFKGYIAQNNDVRAKQDELTKKLKNIQEKELHGENEDDAAVVFMQIKTKDYPSVLKNIGTYGGIAFGGALMLPVIRPITTGTIGLLANPVGLLAVGTAAIAGGVYTYINVQEGRAAAAGYCGKVSATEEEAKEGCSMVEVIPYNKQAIDSLCYKTEEIP